MPATTTATEKSHFSAVIPWRVDNGVLEFMVIDYQEGGRTQIKFPGGMNEGDEKPFKTAWRETKEETGHDMPIDGPFYHYQADAYHSKFFFASECSPDWRGQPRQVAIEDGERRETIHPPRWISAETAAKKLFLGHRRALKRAVSGLAEHNVKFREALEQDLRFQEALRYIV